MSMEVPAPPESEPNAPQPVRTEQQPAPSPGTSRQRRPGKVAPKRGHQLSELILLCVAVVDAFLALDFVFRATAVSRDGFVGVVARVGDALASPFAGLFRPGVPAVGHTTFWAALLALAIYTIAALILIRLIHLLTSPLRRHVRDA